jgi:hypothetical protein
VKTACHVYWFTSASSDTVHETIRWTDGTLSCSCPGWCKRNGPAGRTCKHVRIVAAGQGASMASRHGPVNSNTAPVAAPDGYKLPKPQRRFEFE